MSGPIIRKYGFPNHEQIFGKRPLEHGAGAGADAVKPDATANEPADPKSEGKGKGRSKPGSKKP